LKIKEESSACPETMGGPNEGQKSQDPNNTIGSAVKWTPSGELLWGGNLDCKGIIIQGFIIWGPSLEVASLSCLTPLYHLVNISGVHHVGDSTLGNLG